MGRVERSDWVANYIRTASNTTFNFIAINEYTIVPTILKLEVWGNQLILVPPHISSSVIHIAIEVGVVWPHYVWVVVLLQPSFLTLSPMWKMI